jgi:hypothetical protein
MSANPPRLRRAGSLSSSLVLNGSGGCCAKPGGQLQTAYASGPSLLGSGPVIPHPLYRGGCSRKGGGPAPLPRYRTIFAYDGDPTELLLSGGIRNGQEMTNALVFNAMLRHGHLDAGRN